MQLFIYLKLDKNRINLFPYIIYKIKFICFVNVKFNNDVKDLNINVNASSLNINVNASCILNKPE